MKLDLQFEFMSRYNLRTAVKAREYENFRRNSECQKIEHMIIVLDTNLNVCQGELYAKINEQVR